MNVNLCVCVRGCVIKKLPLFTYDRYLCSPILVNTLTNSINQLQKMSSKPIPVPKCIRDKKKASTDPYAWVNSPIMMPSPIATAMREQALDQKAGQRNGDVLYLTADSHPELVKTEHVPPEWATPERDALVKSIYADTCIPGMLATPNEQWERETKGIKPAPDGYEYTTYGKLIPCLGGDRDPTKPAKYIYHRKTGALLWSATQRAEYIRTFFPNHVPELLSHQTFDEPYHNRMLLPEVKAVENKLVEHSKQCREWLEDFWRSDDVFKIAWKERLFPDLESSTLPMPIIARFFYAERDSIMASTEFTTYRLLIEQEPLLQDTSFLKPGGTPNPKRVYEKVNDGDGLRRWKPMPIVSKVGALVTDHLVGDDVKTQHGFLYFVERLMSVHHKPYWKITRLIDGMRAVEDSITPFSSQFGYDKKNDDSVDVDKTMSDCEESSEDKDPGSYWEGWDYNGEQHEADPTQTPRGSKKHTLRDVFGNQCTRSGEDDEEVSIPQNILIPELPLTLDKDNNTVNLIPDPEMYLHRYVAPTKKHSHVAHAKRSSSSSSSSSSEGEECKATADSIASEDEQLILPKFPEDLEYQLKRWVEEGEHIVKRFRQLSGYHQQNIIFDRVLRLTNRFQVDLKPSPKRPRGRVIGDGQSKLPVTEDQEGWVKIPDDVRSNISMKLFQLAIVPADCEKLVQTYYQCMLHNSNIGKKEWSTIEGEIIGDIQDIWALDGYDIFDGNPAIRFAVINSMSSLLDAMLLLVKRRALKQAAKIVEKV